MKYLESVSQGNTAFIIDMLNIFITRTPETFDILKKAIQEEDWQSVGFYAHKLKATYAYVGLEDLKKTIIEIEQKAKHITDTHTITELFDYLENMTKPEITAITTYKLELELKH
ncbi:MAG: Hpt domain-containing protein [bacterium]|jgi:HPt (histidine-containing phosphotransfer) domain-containing protein